MDWWNDFTLWLDNPSRTGPMETVKDGIVGIGVVAVGTIAMIILCIVACALANAILVLAGGGAAA